MHATAPVPDPRAVRPDLSPTFAAIIAKLMAKDPDDRYQSGESLLADLHRLAPSRARCSRSATDDARRPAGRPETCWSAATRR